MAPFKYGIVAGGILSLTNAQDPYARRLSGEKMIKKGFSMGLFGEHNFDKYPLGVSLAIDLVKGGGQISHRRPKGTSGYNDSPEMDVVLDYSTWRIRFPPSLKVYVGAQRKFFFDFAIGMMFKLKGRGNLYKRPSGQVGKVKPEKVSSLFESHQFLLSFPGLGYEFSNGVRMSFAPFRAGSPIKTKEELHTFGI